jgi:hypothetical protein
LGYSKLLRQSHVKAFLIFDIWNPFLSEAERELVTAMMNARNSYYTSGASPT